MTDYYYKNNLKTTAAILYESGYRHYEDLNGIIDWPMGASEEYKNDLRNALEEYDTKQIAKLTDEVECDASSKEIESYIAETWTNYRNSPEGDVTRIVKEIRAASTDRMEVLDLITDG